MKKEIYKRFFCTICIIFISFLCFGNVSLAAETETKEEITPRYVISCPSGGKHYMASNGWANVYEGTYQNNTLKWRTAPQYQCKYCHLIIVTKNEVSPSRAIGEYTIWHTQEPVTAFLSLYTTNFYYESGKELSGYEFH